MVITNDVNANVNANVIICWLSDNEARRTPPKSSHNLIIQKWEKKSDQINYKKKKKRKKKNKPNKQILETQQ